MGISDLHLRRGVIVLLLGASLVLASIRTGVFPAAAPADSTDWLVNPEWLKGHLDDKSLVVVDTRPETDYLKGHVSGAIWMDAAALSATTSADGLKALTEELGEKFAPLGIERGDSVVFYEDGVGVRAPRALWYFTYAGYQGGKVLEGGFKTWQAAHFPVSQEKAVRKTHPLVVKANPRVLATSEYVLQHLNDPGVVILDVRSRDEYVGKEPNSRSPGSGHIPGARWLEWTQLLDGNVRYLTNEELLKKFSRVGVTPDKEVIVYCHGGNRASNTFLALQRLGFPRVRNYVGSWQEWAARPELPLSTDDPQPPD